MSALAAVNMAGVHAIGPGDIIGECATATVDVSRIEPVIQTPEDFDIGVLSGQVLARAHLSPGESGFIKASMTAVTSLEPWPSADVRAYRR